MSHRGLRATWSVSCVSLTGRPPEAVSRLEFGGIFDFAEEEHGLGGSVDNQQQEGPVEADGMGGGILRPDGELGGRGRGGGGAVLADVQHSLVGGLPGKTNIDPFQKLSFGVLPGNGDTHPPQEAKCLA